MRDVQRRGQSGSGPTADLTDPVSEALTSDAITQLNASVDVDGETGADVAKQWLEDNNLLN